MNTFGTRVRAMRLALGLSQRELGRLAGIADTHAKRLEGETQSPSLETLRNLAAALGVTVGELVDEPLPEHMPELSPVGLRSARLARGLSRRALSEAAGLGPNAAARFESGASGATLATATALARALGATAVRLGAP
jgi:transcriptional regulator with XRE-family HTH domain